MQLKKFTWLGPTNEIGKGTDLEDRTAIGGGRDIVNDNVVADPKGADPIIQDGRRHRVLSRKRITKNTVHTVNFPLIHTILWRLPGRSSGTTAEINHPPHPLHQNAKEHEVLHLGRIPAILFKNLLATRIVSRVTTLSEVFHINGAEDVSQVAVDQAEGHRDEGETAGRTRVVDEILPVKDTRNLPFVVRNLTTTPVVGYTAPILKTILDASRGTDLCLAIQQSPPIQSADNPLRSPSPPQPIPSFDVDTTSALVDGDVPRESVSMHGMRASDARDTKSSNPRSHLDTRQYSTSPQYVTPSNSYHGSPQSTSPYSGGRGGRNGQQPPHTGRSPPYRQPPTGPQSQFYQGQSQFHPSANHIPTGPRGGHSGYRGNYQNQGGGRRFSASGSQNYSNAPSPRGRGSFTSFQWSGPGSRNRGPHSPHTSHGQTSQTPPPPTTSENQAPMGLDQGDITIRPSGQDHPMGEEKPESEIDDAQKMPPTNIGQPDTSATPNKGGKISFAFKAKTTPAPAPKPVPDLAQRMLAREPPPRVAEPPRNRMANGPPPKFKPEPRFDRRDRDRERERDRHRERDRDRGRNDRRDFRDPRGFRDPRDRREGRRDDHRFDHRHDRRRGDRRQDFRPERRRDRSPEPKKQPKVLVRPKPRPTIPEEFAKSDSVYYRKPGNESVIGAGTYGKVFKAIHVYTQRKVALKKIRMEGEKDGFPVTAVREIKLLQHLRNDNVVSLLEVMVERNECFMVFEYLSHDLTGLINHPTFTLTAAHKKDLAKQMFEGLSYLHHRGVLHRDIKAANILISNRGQLKYADFGLARFFSKSRQLDYTNRVITIWYRPPELLLGETRYGPAVDVWSAACVYVEMFTKKAVFPGEGGEISQMEKLYNCLGTPTRAEWPDIVEMPWFELMRPTERKRRVFEEVYGQILTPAALDLVSQIFRYDPTARPNAEEILAHPYFAEEEPRPQQAIELENIEGDWHEFESKALRKEKDREARRAEYQRDKEKRKAGTSAPPSERETKRTKQDAEDSQSSAQPTEQ
ncbi:protein kinase [Aspergillus flavus]|uniref:cyclin-dependent kinase n=1 Tax=Aspergillus flavus TaxID=5059 RepID=A0AB74CG20_ASPFL|nr:protein kinase [Aspergillus flavus]